MAFGLHQYGITEYIKYAIKEGYKEPKEPINILELLEKKVKFEKPFTDMVKEIDIETGIMDGYSYGSKRRMDNQRKIGFHKPDGPIEMYKFPLTNNMDYGWWMGDEDLKDDKWWLPRKRIMKSKFDYVRYVEEALKTDIYFKT